VWVWACLCDVMSRVSLGGVRWTCYQCRHAEAPQPGGDVQSALPRTNCAMSLHIPHIALRERTDDAVGRGLGCASVRGAVHRHSFVIPI
jgi:hypothetical protein